ncbi:MAG: response regulator [Spirochaeta sp.]|nr:response regulator [Spirochaeta sp.]
MNDATVLLNRIPHPALHIDPFGAIIAVNACFTERFPDTVRVAPGTPVVNALREISGDATEWVTELLHRGVIHAGNESTTYRFNTAAYGIVDVWIMPGGEGTSFLTLITEQDDRRSVRRNRRVIDAFMHIEDSGVFLLDRGCAVVDFNDIAMQFVVSGGAGELRIMGASIGELVTVMQYDQPFDLVDAIRRSMHAAQRREYGAGLSLSLLSGEVAEIEIVIVPIGADPGDDDEMVLIAIENIGERRRVWRELQNLQHAQDIRRAASGIAHELNNSATAMLSTLHRINRQVETGELNGDDIVHMEGALRRVRRLGVQLERFSMEDRFELPDTALETPVLTAEHLQELVNDIIPLATGGTGIRTAFTFDPDLPSVAMPASELTQALFNVAVNAVEAMGDDGTLRIEVRLCAGDDRVCLIVRDNGTGMDPRMVHTAVRPYFSTKSHGIGMGLTIALSLLEGRGGQLTLETEPGFGTTVRMYLPPATPEETNTPTHGVHARRLPEHPDHRWSPDPEDASKTVDFSQSRVLLVEDDPLVRRSMEIMIRNIGCEVISVQSGDRAIVVYQDEIDNNRTIDALVTDFAMPGRVNGIQLVRRLREFTPELPAVLSSGALHRNNAAGFRDAGFQFVLRKPFGEPEIREALAVALTPEI